MTNTLLTKTQDIGSSEISYLVNIKYLTFWVVFFFTFVFAGPLTLLNTSFRLSPVALFILPLLSRTGVKINTCLIMYCALILVVVISGWSNSMSIIDIALFSRALLISFLVYFLIDVHITHDNYLSIINHCIVLGTIQIPIVIAERAFYTVIPAGASGTVIYEDIGLGTFRDDPSLAFFLLSLLILLLFSRHAKQITRYRIPSIILLTLGIFLANSEIMKLTTVLAWAIYLIRHFNIKTIAAFILTTTAVILVLSYTGVLDHSYEKMSNLVETRMTFNNAHRVDRYLEGSYSRSAAIMYHLNRDISLLGEGPGKFTKPLSRTKLRGDTGHIFLFYSEVGLLGWGFSVAIFYMIAKSLNLHGRITRVSLLLFISIQILSFTHLIMNSLGVILIYCIVIRADSLLHYPEVADYEFRPKTVIKT